MIGSAPTGRRQSRDQARPLQGKLGSSFVKFLQGDLLEVESSEVSYVSHNA
jgi:hypothetical protein